MGVPGTVIEFLLNPEGIETIFFDSLNVSYRNWGDQALYDWCFKRRIGKIRADLLLAKLDGRFVYGTALHTRYVKDSSGRPNQIALIGSGWTLPEYRGRGFSTKGIARSIEILREMGYKALFGFIRKENVSYQNMVENGAVILPSRYFHFPVSEMGSHYSNDLIKIESQKYFIDKERRSYPSRNCRNHFVYTEEEWKSQFLDRPGSVNAYISSDASSGVLLQEKSDRLIISSTFYSDIGSFRRIMTSTLRFAQERGKGLSHYGIDIDEFDVLKDMGFHSQDGGVAIFPLGNDITNDAEEFVTQPWSIMNGDRM